MVVALPQCDAPLGYTGRADRTIVERPRPLHKKAERRAVARLGGVEHGTSRSSDGAFEQTERKRTQVNAWEAPSFTPVRFTFSSVAPKRTRNRHTDHGARRGLLRVSATRVYGHLASASGRAREKGKRLASFGRLRVFARSPIRPSQSLTHSLTRATP